MLSKRAEPSYTLSDDTYARLGLFLEEKTGINMASKRRTEVEYSIAHAAQEAGYSDQSAFIEEVIHHPVHQNQAYQSLIRHITIGETYFFRDHELFSILEKQILPEMIEGKRRTGQPLRIWSAGCSTGEEPYSVAMVLRDLSSAARDLPMRIIGTDINIGSLGKASNAVYSNWSFRETPSYIRTKYFRPIEDDWLELNPDIRQMVDFEQINLMEEEGWRRTIPEQSMDLIICRNVMIYFSAATNHTILQGFHRTLINGGILIVGTSEGFAGGLSLYNRVNIGERNFYLKSNVKVEDPVSHRPERGRPRLDVSTRPRPKRVAITPEISVQTPPRPAILPAKAEANGNPKFAYEKAVNLYKNGQFQEAATLGEKLLQANPSDAKTLMLLSHICADAGELEKAYDFSEKAREGFKLSAYYYYYKSSICSEMMKYQEAVDALKKAVYLNPSFAMAYFALGNAYLQLNMPAEAGRNFRITLEMLDSLGEEDRLFEDEGVPSEYSAQALKGIIGRKISTLKG